MLQVFVYMFIVSQILVTNVNSNGSEKINNERNRFIPTIMSSNYFSPVECLLRW